MAGVIEILPPAIPFDWDHVYVLDVYDHAGKTLQARWTGPHPVHAVVLGVERLDPGFPFGDACVPVGATVEGPFEYDEAQRIARERGGYAVIAWHTTKPVERR